MSRRFIVTDVRSPWSEAHTLGDLLEQLGGVPAARVRFHPIPGTATEDDVLAIERRENRLCELVDGVLVEKAIGFRESIIAIALGQLLRAFVVPRNLGLVTGADGMVRLFPGMVRIPDVAFVSWERLPGGRVPMEPIPSLAPDLAVEVLSAGNTPGEMDRKRREYFAAGVRLLWFIDLERRVAEVHTGPEAHTLRTEDRTLDGGDVLPGLAIPLRELFAELDRQAGPA